MTACCSLETITSQESREPNCVWQWLSVLPCKGLCNSPRTILSILTPRLSEVELCQECKSLLNSAAVLQNWQLSTKPLRQTTKCSLASSQSPPLELQPACVLLGWRVLRATSPTSFISGEDQNQERGKANNWFSSPGQTGMTSSTDAVPWSPRDKKCLHGTGRKRLL